MRTWLNSFRAVLSGRRYQRRLRRDQIGEVRREDEIGHAQAGIHYPRA